MYPILFRIGSYAVYAYTVTLVLGVIGGTWVALARARTLLTDPGIVLDAGFWALVGGILGGRAGYVLANWAYFGHHVDRAIDITGGGLSWHGALGGSLAAVAVWYIIRSKYSSPVPGWRELSDAIAPGVALGCAAGWLGCLLAGVGYGQEAAGYAPPLSWLTANLRDIYGVDQIRFLTQPLMILWCLLLWVLLHSAHRLPRGIGMPLYLLLYALADFGVTFLRGDGTWRYGLWLSQWVNVAEACAAVAVCIYVWTRVDRSIRPPFAAGLRTGRTDKPAVA